jgi:hypothetical protein
MKNENRKSFLWIKEEKYSFVCLHMGQIVNTIKFALKNVGKIIVEVFVW